MRALHSRFYAAVNLIPLRIGCVNLAVCIFSDAHLAQNGIAGFHVALAPFCDAPRFSLRCRRHQAKLKAAIDLFDGVRTFKRKLLADLIGGRFRFEWLSVLLPNDAAALHLARQDFALLAHHLVVV